MTAIPGSTATDFLAGVIEGFYGQPWTPTERGELFDWMSAWGLNTYLYAPKDDLKHRAIWREPYSPSEATALKELIADCHQHGLHFIYALSPGLDIRYHDPAELDLLKRRFEQMLSLECDHFAVLFDDIPDVLDPATARRWGSLAAAQSYVANDVFHWTRSRKPQCRFLFCPTAYCGRMARMKLGGEDYLPILGRELRPEIDVFWTGPEIISREITVAHVEEVRSWLRRKPVIWDNLHANDYDGRRFYCGPYAGRPAELKQSVSGLLSNPNNEFPLNYVPLRTLAEFVKPRREWVPRQAYLCALAEWLPRFETIAGAPLTLRDLTFLCDCYYLPYEEGPEAEALYAQLAAMLWSAPANWGENAAAFQQQAGSLRDTCAKLVLLRHRPLFYALSRRLWELREELDLLGNYLQWKTANPGSQADFTSDFHLPQTYRGGFVVRLQSLLTRRRDGTFAAREPDCFAARETIPANPSP